MLKGLVTGKLDVLLTIEQLTRTPNDIGETIEYWSLYKQAFGERKLKSSVEKFEARQEVASDNAVYTIRYDAGLDDTMRLKQEQETTYFYITNVQQERRMGYSIITAVRRDNQ